MARSCAAVANIDSIADAGVTVMHGIDAILEVAVVFFQGLLTIEDHTID